MTSSWWDLVVEAARERPDHVVLADDHGRSLTTTGLRDAADRVAAGLWSLGVRTGDVVSWQLPTVLEAPVLMAACARLGAVQNPIIAVLREREVGFIVDQVGTRLLVVPETWRDFGHGALARSLPVPALVLDLAGPPGPELRLPTGDPAVLPPPPAASAGCRWIYYTSGTTAEPKGARHTDASAIASSNGIVHAHRVGPDDVIVIPWPLAHIGGVSMLSAVLRAGGRLLLLDSWDPATSPDRVAAHRPTILGSATPFFLAYTAAQRRHGADPLYPALRLVVAGGAPTPEPVVREVSQVLGVRGICDAWGMTEFPVATSQTGDGPDLGRSAGAPAPGVRVRIVDGELLLKGPQCFLGYVDRALDADAFDPDGWLRTGDLGVVDELGHVHITGRRKDVIIRNAENISAVEVEEVLLRHPAVSDAAVIGVPDPRTGERVVAVLVVDRDLPLVELAAHCAEHELARFKFPERAEVLDVLPRNPMGKVLKAELRERFG
jgi:acyl-CoA synthetase (AMP-forming)/AMP-acid ligase II